MPGMSCVTANSVHRSGGSMLCTIVSECSEGFVCHLPEWFLSAAHLDSCE